MRTGALLSSLLPAILMVGLLPTPALAGSPTRLREGDEAPLRRAKAAPRLTFRCSFDGTVEPQVHAGSGAAKLDGKAEYAPGVSGQALVVGDGKAQLSYPVQGNYPLGEASVSFWVRPLDWRGDDKHFHIFFQASASLPGGRGKGARLVYKYLVPGRFLHLVIPDEPIPYVNFQGACYADIAAWKPGEWHHVVATWRAAGMTLYLDGKPVGGRPYDMMPMNMGGRFQFGDRTWGKGRKATSLVDELTIYDRQLNEAEVALLYRRHAPSAARSRELPLALRPFLLSRRLEVYADTWGLGSPTVLHVELRRGSFLLLATDVPARGAHGLAKAVLPLPNVPPGEFLVTAEARSKAGARRGFATLTVPPDPPWLGTKVGVSDTVPPPWTDMHERNGNVCCWNRTYALKPGPLPRQIISAGKPLLAKPIELTIEANGRAVPWHSTRLTITDTRPTCVRFEGSAATKGAKLEVQGRIEYDGMAWFDATLVPTSDGLEVERIALDISLRSPVVRFWHGLLARTTEKLAGEVSTEDGRAFASAFVPALWVGSDDRGIQWFTESSEPWDDPKRPDSIQVIRKGEVTVLRIEPVASKRTLTKPWRFAFGLQASPVRPVERDWRRLRLSGVPGTAYLIWTNPKDMIWFGYPRARDPKALKARIDDFHRRNVTVVPYSCPFLLSINSPESTLYGAEWLRLGEGDSGSGDVVRMGGCAQYVPPSGPHYADFTLWAHHKFVTDIGWDGLYFDHSNVKALDYAPAGCGYVRDGARLPTYPILATRDILKRMYTMLKEISPRHWLMIHTSGAAILPMHGFADIRALGEDLGMRLTRKPDYHAILTEAEWRAIQCGDPYGFSNILLPKLPKKAWDDPAPTQQVMGLILLYNMDLWGGYSHAPSRGAMRKACNRFGIIGAEFIPFWRNPPRVKATDPSVRVSVYRQPRRVMLVLVNKSPNPVATRVEFQPFALGLSDAAPWRDLLADKPLKPGSAIELAPGNYRLIQIGEGAKP